MRNPARIDPICEKLRMYWKNEAPDWRFGQLMSNFLSYVAQNCNRDPFYVEDAEVSRLLDEYFTPEEERPEGELT